MNHYYFRCKQCGYKTVSHEVAKRHESLTYHEMAVESQ